MPHFETPQPISVELNLRLANVRVTAGDVSFDAVVRIDTGYGHDSRPSVTT